MTPRLTLDSQFCPFCKGDLRAGPIPGAEREMFGGAENFLRTIVHNSADGRNFIECPDCHHKEEM